MRRVRWCDGDGGERELEVSGPERAAAVPHGARVRDTALAAIPEEARERVKANGRATAAAQESDGPEPRGGGRGREGARVSTAKTVGGRVDRTLPLVLIAVASALPLPVAAQEADDYSRFRLYTGCAMDLFVHASGGTGLAEGETEVAVRSRLRAARIYDPEALDSLHVFVSRWEIAGEVRYRFELSFWKTGFQDPRTGTSGGTPTWETEAIGRFEALRGLLDRFLDEYLRVNECGQ
ncbi:hypothetical protein [Candidatus Palauibacter sp.]|uniref:hypothetical protein n=1 Tax=Candidatus Palauibacter sp. TaxID=3101350 RepID=UPI003B52E336